MWQIQCDKSNVANELPKMLCDNCIVIDTLWQSVKNGKWKIQCLKYIVTNTMEDMMCDKWYVKNEVICLIERMYHWICNV